MEKKTISAKELMKRWNLNDIDFVNFIADNLPKLHPVGNKTPFLVPYDKTTIQIIDFNLFASKQGRVRILRGIDSVYFFLDDIKSFEVRNKPAKETKLQKIKRLVGQEADKLWQQDPSITIADMIMKDEISNVCDRVYSEKTLRNWIKGFARNNEPGRRKTH